MTSGLHILVKTNIQKYCSKSRTWQMTELSKKKINNYGLQSHEQPYQKSSQ
jgi:hypothetical protein